MQAPNLVSKKYADIHIGDKASFVTTITPETVEAFALLSGDHNPLHMDEVFAAATPFKGRLAHGMLAGAFFSRLVGMHLPGLYCVYLSQTLQFKNPVRLNTQVEISGVVSAKSDATQAITLQMCMIEVSSNTVLVGGEGLVKVTK